MITQLSLPTALGPNDPDDGDAGRRQRGMAIAALVPVSKDKIGYRVPSQSSKGSYIVTLNGKGGKDGCSCPDYEERQRYCKHLYAVKYIIQREELADGSVAETRAVRVTYGRNWSAYNSAQSHEGEHFVTLLRALSRASTKHTSGAEQKCTTREVIGQRKCPRQLFGRSVTEAGWQQAGRVSE